MIGHLLGLGTSRISYDTLITAVKVCASGSRERAQNGLEPEFDGIRRQGLMRRHRTHVVEKLNGVHLHAPGQTAQRQYIMHF